MSKREMTRKPSDVAARSCAVALASVLGFGFAGCGGALGDDEWADADGAELELEEGQELELGHSEQPLIRVGEVAGDIGAGEFDPVDPDPPPPPPPEDPCKADPVDAVRAALGYRVIQAFGRTDPHVWECVPGSPGCSSVRLHSALRSGPLTPAQLTAVGHIDELLGSLSALGGMTAFANRYSAGVAECTATACSTAARSFVFTPAAPDACNDIVVKIDAPLRQTIIEQVTGGVLDSRATLSQSTPAPAPTSPIVTTSWSSASSLATFSARRLTTVTTTAGTTTAPPPPPPPPPSSVYMLNRDLIGQMLPFYALYGGYRNPCPDPTATCNATGVNTAIKTYLDQTCEGTSTSATDVCHHRTYDEKSYFIHLLAGFPGAVRERLGERCGYDTYVNGQKRTEFGTFKPGSGTLALCQR